ncbi:S8 family serine peptidase [Shouchella lonarensis]|uniref:Peptidase inhibitor I9 n=1 Tax=Shouchella lonarensis TaxID=1464122 RepID=A0A1G6P6P1_9BACI|nr:S8 family serine peptidase [Shouchella lonarensis]SDC75294.1 Peptidase inhibitor I9 [Shouchella lonarensis]
MKKTRLRYVKIACAATLSVSMITATSPALIVSAETKSKEETLYIDDKIDLNSEEDVSVIVELKEVPEQVALVEAEAEGEKLTEKEAKNHIEVSQEAFIDALDEVVETKSEYEVERTYSKIFNGAALTLPANKVEKLLDYEGIKAIYKNDKVELVRPLNQKTSTETVTKETTGSTPRLGVAEMHTEGFTGKGIKVGVIDTGIDYNHPDLKSAYKGGYDFVDDDDDPMETTYDDWLEVRDPDDPDEFFEEYYTAHGTHVAGIIAGQAENNVDHAVLGVAPDVDLYAYRVLGPGGWGETADIIAAIEQSVLDEMDIINLSLGSPENTPLTPESIAVNNAVLSGVTVVVAAGNDALYALYDEDHSLYTVGEPATASLPIAVGASSMPLDILQFESTYTSENEMLTGQVRLDPTFDEDVDGESLSGQEFELVNIAGSDLDHIDLEGKAVVISAKELFRDEEGRLLRAGEDGAAAVFIYNDFVGLELDSSSFWNFYGTGLDIPTFYLSDEQGSDIAALAEKEVSVKLGASEWIATGDLIASFSSRGPVNQTGAIKPEIVAPGEEIFSTVPDFMLGPEHIGNYDEAYDHYSGTSMAAPYVAGVAALMLQADHDLTPGEVKTRVMNTARPLAKEYNVFEVGAGLIDPRSAVTADVTIQTTVEGVHVQDHILTNVPDQTGALSYGLLSTHDGNIRERNSVRLQNRSSEAKTFLVDVQFQDINGTLPAAESGVVLQTNKKVTIPAGKAVTNNVFLISPKTAKSGVYGGYMTYTNEKDKNEVYRIPFGACITAEMVAPFPIGIEIKDSLAS